MRVRNWLHALWTGDDGKEYAVLTEPSPLRPQEARVVFGLTRREAHRIAQRFISANPYGLAEIRVRDR